MISAFGVLFEEFDQELQAIRILINFAGEAKLTSAKARVAGANAAVLLLAATFEEYIRELAREFARAIVAATPTYDKLPPKLASIAWKRTMEGLARIQLNPKKEIFSRESIFSDAQTRFAVTYEFCRGDLTQDIYRDLIHNENNMRPEQLNALFKLSGLNNVCNHAAEHPDLKTFLGEDQQNATNARLVEALEDFFNRRNQTAHSIRAMQSVSAEAIGTDIDLLRSFGRALAETLEAKAPKPL